MILSDYGYVADRRTFGPTGRQTGGGWMVMDRVMGEHGSLTYHEGASYRTKREAQAALRERAGRSSAAAVLGAQGGRSGRGASKRRDVDYAALGRKGAASRKAAR